MGFGGEMGIQKDFWVKLLLSQLFRRQIHMFQSFKDENKSSLSIVAHTLHSRCLDEGWLLQVSGLYDLKEEFSREGISAHRVSVTYVNSMHSM